MGTSRGLHFCSWFWEVFLRKPANKGHRGPSVEDLRACEKTAFKKVCALVNAKKVRVEDALNTVAQSGVFERMMGEKPMASGDGGKGKGKGTGDAHRKSWGYGGSGGMGSGVVRYYGMRVPVLSQVDSRMAGNLAAGKAGAPARSVPGRTRPADGPATNEPGKTRPAAGAAKSLAITTRRAGANMAKIASLRTEPANCG